jgi:hypothetical protein
MTHDLFLHIMYAVESHDEYFVKKRNAANTPGLSCFQKITAAFRMLQMSMSVLQRVLL